jgi:hypothetical protein
MAKTEVMLIGALPAQAGFPGAGGPIPPSSRFPYPQPNFRMNRHAPIPSTWMEPQNLLQVTDKTNYDPYARASRGAPIVAPLAGVMSPILFGRRGGLGALGADAGGAVPPGSPPVTEGDLYADAASWKSYFAFTAFSYTLLGAMMAGYHGYKRNKGNTGWALGWGLLGGMFPLVTNAVALGQGYGKPHG